MEEMGFMRTTHSLRVVLLIAVIALVPTMARCQDSTGYGRPDPDFPVPLNNQPDWGGPYFAGEFLLFHTNRPVGDQVVAVRGFTITDANLSTLQTRFINPLGTPWTFPDFPNNVVNPGTFVGSGKVAIRANDFGTESDSPGWSIYGGWRFADGLAVDMGWWHVNKVKYAGGATFAAPGFGVGNNLADSFLFSPVTNFSPEFAGPDVKVVTLAQPPPTVIFNPFTITPQNPSQQNVGTVGIWNAATVMQIFYVQHFDEWNVTARIPIFETENTRSYALVGPRMSWIWDAWKWRTTDIDVNGNVDLSDVATYDNIVSNRLYGVHCGCGTECRLGDTPIGTFVCTGELQAAALADIVSEREKYVRGDEASASSKKARDLTFVPEVQASVGLMYYPMEGVEIRVGYDVMAFFNTVGIRDPISFDFANLSNQWEEGTFRYFNGLRAGVGFAF
jgi:hypothetical protein